MDERTNERTEALRPAAGEAVAIKLGDEIGRLRQRLKSQGEGRVAESLVKDGALNVALLLLGRGAVLHEHRTRGPVAIQVLEGSIRFTANGGVNTLSRGEMIALDRDVAHGVEAIEESVLMLTSAIG